MRFQGEAVYLGGRYSEPSEQFPEGSWMATFADDTGDVVKLWCKGSVLPRDPELKSLTPCDIVVNYRQVEAFGSPGAENFQAARKSATLIECRPKGGK